MTDPISDDDFGFWFHPYDRRYFGMRCTHQPSPWILDYGQFRVVASVPSIYQTLKDQASSFQPDQSVWKPYYFNTSLIGYGTQYASPLVEFTSTSHGAIMRIRFPPKVESIYDSGFEQNRRIQILLDGGDGSTGRGFDLAEVRPMPDDGATSIQGYSRANSGGVPSNFHHYFVAAIYTGPKGNAHVGHVVNISQSNEGAFIDLSASDGANDEITIRIGTSFISLDQAIVNLRREVSCDLTLEDLVAQSKQEWHDVLSRTKVARIHDSYSSQEKHDMLTTFYSSLYRASLFPRQLSEVNAEGEEVHYSPYDTLGGVFPGPLATDSGFWDAYSTVCKSPFHSHQQQLHLHTHTFSTHT
jgi:putative alpha-1,2-mannosidase